MLKRIGYPTKKRDEFIRLFINTVWFGIMLFYHYFLTINDINALAETLEI